MNPRDKNRFSLVNISSLILYSSVIIIAVCMISSYMVKTRFDFNVHDITFDQTSSNDKFLSFKYEYLVPKHCKNKLIIVPKKGENSITRIAVFTDHNYPHSLSGDVGYFGFTNHLRAHLHYNDSDIPVTDVSAQELFDTISSDLANNTATESAIVIQGGILPDILYDQNLGWENIKKWIDKGGTMFWAGEIPGYKYGKRITENGGGAISLDPGAVNSLVDSRIYYETNQKKSDLADTATKNTKFSEIFDFKYFYTVRAPLARGVKWNNGKDNGAALGRLLPSSDQEHNLSSISLLPTGEGNIVIFGGGIFYNSFTKEEEIATDIAKIINFGILDMAENGDAVYSEEIQQFSNNLSYGEIIDLPISISTDEVKIILKSICIANEINQIKSFTVK